MKTFCKTAMIVVCLLLFINDTEAQATQAKLNQIQLLKQFLGTWKTEYSNGNIMISDFTPFGSSMVCNNKIIHADTLIDSSKSLWGLDKNTDKIIFAQVDSSYDYIMIDTCWFTSNNTLVSSKHVSPDSGDTLGWRYEFKATDLLLFSTINNTRNIVTYKSTRVGK
jgi:hypothetical protein